MKRILAAMALAALVAGAVPATASTFVAMTPREMVKQAEAVVEGTVVGSRSFWSESGRIIFTEFDVAVESRLVGEAPQMVTVRVPGGEVDGYVVEAAGFPMLENDSRVILFLDGSEEKAGRGFYTVLGHQQGHYQVVERLDGVVLAVPQVDEGAQYLTRDGRAVGQTRSVEVESFRAGVRNLAERVGREVN